MIKTNRLILKSIEDIDQEAMIDLFTNDQIKQTYMLPDFESKENAVKLFQRMQAITKKEDTVDCGIYLQDTLIGFLNTVLIEDKKIELGYVIDPEFQNKGFATETLRATIQKAFGLGYEKVITGAFEDNAASRRVMEKCGMSLIEENEDIEYRGNVHHCVYYAIENR